MSSPPLLDVQSLSIGFAREDIPGVLGVAVEEASFTLRRGRTLCLVGESGCGKSVTALSVLRLLPSPPSVLMGGSILFDGQDLTRLTEAELRHIRGNRIGMVFQDPMTSLNPVMRVGEQMVEGLRRHQGLSSRAAHDAAAAMLEKVGIPNPAQRVRDFPHQMSGGMRQRVMIGMALACDPALIIADEPTTALDVTVQKQILELMCRSIATSRSGLLLITHDLGVVSQVADDVAVMYAGRIVEHGPARTVLANPQHPYTVGLLRSRPAMHAGGGKGTRLEAIPGTVPGMWQRPAGCTFHPRCPHAFERCKVEIPPFFSIGGGVDSSPDKESRSGTAEAALWQSRCWLNV